MSELQTAIIGAVWLGLLTAISPCPLATNIAAVSFVARHLGSPRRALWAGLLYAAGRALAYLVLGMLLVNGMMAAPGLAQFLQKQLNLLMGPLLVIVGMVLLGLVSFRPSGGHGGGLQKRVEGLGIWGAFLLGVVFALSFCPTSAALFFGGLLPLALQAQSGALISAVYGIATGLPVVLFSAMLALGAHTLAAAFNRVTVFEEWARRVTGLLFLLLGIWFSMARIWF